MESRLELISSLIWFPQAISQILLWLYWWQTKEYRWDRFKILLKSNEGRKKLKLNDIALKIILISSSYFVKSFSWAAIFLFLVLDCQFLSKIIKREVKRPKFTLRAGIVLIISLIPTLLVISGIFPLIIGEFSLIFSLIVGIALTALVVNQVKKKILKKAKTRLEKIKPIVIGVTGSYGKTTTKDFIAHLLSQKYPIAKTTGNKNTPIGIAQEVVKNLKYNSRFFIVEMGAYKKGEIKALAKIVHPQIGIITGIGSQHLALFGSLEEIKKTKFELIESLPSGGTAIFNFANSYCRQMARQVKKLGLKLKVLSYGTQVKIVAVTPQGITFVVEEGKIKQKIFAPIAGIHFVENLLGAILIARIFGISWTQIKQGCQTITTSPKTMQVYQLKNGITIIDDSYNANPQGFEAALNYLSLFKGKKKIVFTPGIIELGKTSQATHQTIGRLMAKTTSKIILTNKEFANDIRKGLGKETAKLKIIENLKKQQNQFLKLAKNPDSVILLEGRIPQKLLNLIKNV